MNRDMNTVGVKEPPCFAFGRGDQPLAIIGGGLILDSGEAENTFVFRCQDRFLVYTSLLGLPSVVLVLDEGHRRQYEHLLGTLDSRLQRLVGACGVSAPRIPTPVYLRCDLQTLSLSATESFATAADALASSGKRVYFLMNQVSPTTARILCELTIMLRCRGVRVEFDDVVCEQVATLAQAWHNKARFMVFQHEAAIENGPPRLPSMVLEPEEFVGIGSWAALAASFAARCNQGAPPAELFLKSSQDSSGNVSVILSEATFPERAPVFAEEVRRWLLAEGFSDPKFVQELRAECELQPSWGQVRLHDTMLTELRQGQARRRSSLPLIVQPVLRPSADASGSPASLGVSLFIDDDACHRVVAVTAQLYRDTQRRQFLGLSLHDDLLQARCARELTMQCHSMAGAVAAHGYRGPVNFDACLGPDGRYWFTGDCNPRLTAVYVPLAVRAWLRSCGIIVHSLTSFGYRGEFVIQDVRLCLEAWSSAGLLFSRRRPQGILILPNLARNDGHDALAINLDVEQASEIFAQMRKLVPQAVPAHLQSIYG